MTVWQRKAECMPMMAAYKKWPADAGYFLRRHRQYREAAPLRAI